MKRLVIANLARADLREIGNYTKAQWGAVQKQRYLAATRSRLWNLRKHPEGGRPRPDLSGPYRSLLFGAHIAFYRIEKNEAIVVRILHQAMDPKRYLQALAG